MKKILYISFFLLTNNAFSQIDSTKINQLQEVVVTAKKSAVEQKADRVIYNFSNQSYLNSGTLMQGLKKIPGLIASDVAGMMYQGKQLEIYMDGRPLHMYSDELNTYIESLPANTVEKVEIITQPGAEFPATSGNAILNIVTSKSTKKYISAIYSNGYGYTNYDKPRHRYNNGIALNAKNNLFGWQLQLGQSYTQKYQIDSFNSGNQLLSSNRADKINHLFFVKSGLKFDIKQDRLLLNYDFSTNNNNSYFNAIGYDFSSDDKSKSKSNNNDIILVYQKRFKNPEKKLDISVDFNNGVNGFNLFDANNKAQILNNNSKYNFYQFKSNFTNQFKFLNSSKYNVGVLAEKFDFKTQSLSVTNLNYVRNIISSFSEVQSTYKNFDFILGGRLEAYDIYGNTTTGKSNEFKQIRLFPNATVQYNIMDDIFVNVNYNKKISLPNTSSLNPNNTSYQNQNVTFFGNPNLNPTIYNKFEIKFSALEYFTIGYSISNANNAVATRIIKNNSGVANVSVNIPKATIENFNVGLPIPFMLFTKGLKKTLEFDFNPDRINFLYLYTDYQKNNIEGVKTKGYWNFNLMLQIILPKELNFTTNFNTNTANGNYSFYYTANNRFNEQLDISLSKKFLSNNLAISVYCSDLLNTNYKNISAFGTDYTYYNKYDSRRIGFSLSYKFPSKNKPRNESSFIPLHNKEEQSMDKL